MCPNPRNWGKARAMGGHGGLNILPQKRWNVYNFDNREKVRKDEEEAAKEEQLKREQSRKRDTEFRLEQLRQARGSSKSESKSESKAELKTETKSKNDHINLFEGIKIFDPIDAGIKSFDDDKRGRFKQLKREATKLKKESEAKVVAPEDEKYKLGYGLVGKGVKLPWYMSKKPRIEKVDWESEGDDEGKEEGNKRNGGGKKTIEEMREERLKRERRERERVKALLSGKGPRDGPDYKDRYYTKRA